MVNKQRLFDIFHELLLINSPSLKEKAIADYIANYFLKLGLGVSLDDSSKTTGSNTGNLICKIKGTKLGQPILFNAHMDTIESTKKLHVLDEKGVLKSDGKSILGADNKAGLAVIMEMAEVLKEGKLDHLPVEIVFSVAEEIGLVGANAFDFSMIESQLCFCFDGGGPAGYLIMKAPTQDKIFLNFKGKAVHAGIEPEKGVNAIYAAANAAADFPQGRIDKETTANLGTFQGGKATNIVADEAEFSAEVRSHNSQKLNEIVSKIEDVAKKAASETGANVDINRQTSFVGFRLEQDETVTKIATEAMKELGLDPVFVTSGGGSDANVFNLKGIRTLTLSTGAQMAHSSDEFVDKEELVKTAELAVKIVEVASGTAYG